jgi:hypothetical protein
MMGFSSIDFTAFNQVLTFDAATAYGMILAIVSFTGFCTACLREKRYIKRVTLEAAG